MIDKNGKFLEAPSAVVPVDKQPIDYPYLPEGRTIEYVPADDYVMQCAKAWAVQYSMDRNQPVGAAIVKNGHIVSYGTNGSIYHERQGCKRRELGCKTGEGYDLCPGCSPAEHAEPKAIANMKGWNQNGDGASIYVWGHWWVCQHCWDAIIAEGISRVVLQEGSEIEFRRPIVEQDVDLAPNNEKSPPGYRLRRNPKN